MSKKEKKSPKSSSNEYILSSDAEAILYGLMMVLISLIGFLNYGVAGEALTYIFSYVFGVFYVFVYLLLIFFGLYLMVKKSFYKIHIDLKLLGSLLLVVGFCIAASMGQNLTLDTFFSAYSNKIANTQSHIFAMSSTEAIYANLGGGFIGYLLTAALNSAISETGTSIVVFVFVVLGLILLFKNLAFRFFKALRNFYLHRKEIRSLAKKEREKNDALQNLNISTKESKVEEKVALKEEEQEKPILFDDLLSPKRQTASTVLKQLVEDEKDLSNKESESRVETNSNIKQTRTHTYQDDETKKPTFISSESIYSENENNENIEETSQDRIDLRENIVVSPKQSIFNNEDSRSIYSPDLSLERKELKPLQEDIISPWKKEETKDISSNFNEEDDKTEEIKDQYIYPSIDLLKDRINKDETARKQALADERLRKINECFSDLGIGASVISYTIGPSVTRFDVKVNSNVKTNVLCSIENDLAVRLGGNKTVRLETIVEGKDTSGIEVGNDICDTVSFKECMYAISSNTKDRLLFPLGKDISGNVISCRLDEMPHLLVCGTTGSGKSVFVHNIIASLIMRNKPDELKLMLIDPKRIEFTKYNELPHLLCPIITSTDRGKVGLMRLVDEMERRYDLFAEKGQGASNYKEYIETCEEMGYEKIPYIVMICDEFADFMADGDKETAKLIQRIAQKARACGIYMVIATQRPSVKVITGEIKANIPSRIALSVSSQMDSRIIIDEPGAENLMGRGDLLARIPSHKSLLRVQSAFIDSKEIYAVCQHIKSQASVNYDPHFEDLTLKPVSPFDSVGGDYSSSPSFRDFHNDEYYEEAKRFIIATGKCSTTKLQNQFRIGFSRADGILDTLEKDGIIKRDGNRRVLADKYQSNTIDDGEE